MKKRFLLLLVLTLLFALTGCSDEEALNFDINKEAAINYVKAVVNSYNEVSDVEYEYYNSDNKPIAGTSYSYTHAFLEEAGILRDIEVNHSLLNEGMFDFIELIDNYYE